MMKHFVSLKEQTSNDLLTILDTAQKLKAESSAGRFKDYLAHKTLVMFFQKTSTRTRLSFESAMTELGGHAIFLDQRSTQFSFSDFKDEMRAAMKFCDILMFRATKASDVETASSLNQVPVIDACSEKYHPCQALGDILTMMEYSGGIDKVRKIVWLGVENNVSNTLKLACAKLGIEVVISAPEANPTSIDGELNDMANATGKVKKVLDLKEALSGADYIHTDTWMDMEFFKDGKILPEFEAEYKRRKEVFMPYQLNADIVNRFAPKARIMHCMPCHVGYEISRDAIDHPNSVIFNQAENRKHIQKAIILWLLGISL